MLIGQYEHSIDAKGRMNFPAKLWEDMGSGFVITKGLDGCIAGYSYEEWKNLSEKVRKLPEAKAVRLKRFFFSGATEVEADKQGRIIIPAHLREYAHLSKNVMVVGVLDRIEIWDKDSWEANTAELTAESINETLFGLDDF